MVTFTFNRQLHLDHFAKIDELKEANKSDYYKKQSEGYKAYITVLKKQLKSK